MMTRDILSFVRNHEETIAKELIDCQGAPIDIGNQNFR
jgi:hypothetical protein